MKLCDVYSKPLKEVIEKLELSNMEIHSDDDGNVRAIELKYTEKKKEPEKKTKDPLWRWEGESHEQTEQRKGSL